MSQIEDLFSRGGPGHHALVRALSDEFHRPVSITMQRDFRTLTHTLVITLAVELDGESVPWAANVEIDGRINYFSQRDAIKAGVFTFTEALIRHVHAACRERIQDLLATVDRLLNTPADEVDWRPTQTVPEDYYAL